MKKIIHLFACLFLFTAIGCAEYGDEDDTPVEPPPCEGDDCGNGDGDEIGPGAGRAVCYTYYDASEDLEGIACRKDAVPGSHDRYTFVGYCGQYIWDYEPGRTRHGEDLGNGYVAIHLNLLGLADGQECEVSYGAWEGSTFVWNQSGDDIMSDAEAGELRECGNRTFERQDGSEYTVYSCGFFAYREEGHRPKPLGHYIER